MILSELQLQRLQLTNRRFIVVGKRIVDELPHQTRLPRPHLHEYTSG